MDAGGGNKDGNADINNKIFYNFQRLPAFTDTCSCFLDSLFVKPFLFFCKAGKRVEIKKGAVEYFLRAPDFISLFFRKHIIGSAQGTANLEENVVILSPTAGFGKQKGRNLAILTVGILPFPLE